MGYNYLFELLVPMEVSDGMAISTASIANLRITKAHYDDCWLRRLQYIRFAHGQNIVNVKGITLIGYYMVQSPFLQFDLRGQDLLKATCDVRNSVGGF